MMTDSDTRYYDYSSGNLFLTYYTYEAGKLSFIA